MILEVQRAILSALEEGRPAVVATVLRHKGSSPGKEHHKMLLLADGCSLGTVGGGRLEAEVREAAGRCLDSGHGEVLDLLVADEGEGAIGGVCGGRALVALEVLPRLPRVLLCGGGHCAEEVARLLGRLGYLHEIHEDREPYLAPARFPDARRLHLGPPEGIAGAPDLAPLDRFSHILLLSRGHDVDRVYARAICAAGYAGWIGMLGSARKARALREVWLEEDGMEPSWVARLESPVGLPIGARSPAEIAVSIVARIVEVRGR